TFPQYVSRKTRHSLRERNSTRGPQDKKSSLARMESGERLRACRRLPAAERPGAIAGKLLWHDSGSTATSRRVSTAPGCHLRATTLQPLLQRHLAFARCSSRKQTFDANVFVDIFPVNSLASRYKPPVVALFLRGVHQTRKPRKRYGKRASVT